MIFAVVGCQMEFTAVQGKFSIADAVAVAADECADIFILSAVILQRIKAKQHIGQLAVLIRHTQRAQCAAIGDDIAAQLPGAQGVLLNGCAVWHGAEKNFFHKLCILSFMAQRAFFEGAALHFSVRGAALCFQPWP